jgi:hypothetical protein
MKTVASTRDQIDGWSIVIGVVIAGSSWSCNDGGKSHGGLWEVLMEVTCLQVAWQKPWWTPGSINGGDLFTGRVATMLVFFVTD